MYLPHITHIQDSCQIIFEFVNYKLHYWSEIFIKTELCKLKTNKYWLKQVCFLSTFSSLSTDLDTDFYLESGSTKHIKIVLNSRFFKDICSKYQVFFQNLSNSRFFQVFLPKLSNSRFFQVSRFFGHPEWKTKSYLFFICFYKYWLNQVCFFINFLFFVNRPRHWFLFRER